MTEKEAELAAFLDNAEIESKAELLANLERAQNTPGKFQAKKIQDAQEKLDALALLESQRATLEEKIAVLIGKPAPSRIKVLAAGASIVNSEDAQIAVVEGLPQGGIDLHLDASRTKIEGSKGASIGRVKYR